MSSGEVAGFGRRLAALIYDALLVAALLMVYTGAVMFATHGHAVLEDTVGGWVYLYRCGLVAVVALYCVLNWVHSGQTLGMRAWRLHAVDLAGQRLRLPAALRRFAYAVLAWLPAALGVLWLYVDPEGLPLQDRLSRSRVLHVPSR